MFAQEGDVIKKKQVMDAITMCRDKEKQLDNKLKKLLLATKQQ